MVMKVLFLFAVVLCVVSALSPAKDNGHPRGRGHRHPKRKCIPHRVTAGCVLQSDPDATSNITGSVHFTQFVDCRHHRSPVRVRIQAKGFTDKDDTIHGIHINELPVNGSCASTGGVYNPFKQAHAGRLQPKKGSPPEHVKRQVGDLGNVAEKKEEIHARFTDHVISLLKRDGLRDIIGRSFVIDAKRDEFGAAGNSGTGMACCTIKMRRRFGHRYQSKAKKQKVL